jgi:hypothetical protein
MPPLYDAKVKQKTYHSVIFRTLPLFIFAPGNRIAGAPFLVIAALRFHTCEPWKVAASGPSRSFMMRNFKLETREEIGAILKKQSLFRIPSF